MEILNAFLVILFIAAFFASWIASVILGIKWAKRNQVSPHWMWFGIHPAGAWIAFPIIRWGSEISHVGDTAVKWVGGKVACASCGKFNPINNAFCAQCGKSITKPLCPRCKSEKTRFVGRVGNYIGWGTLLMVFGASAVNFGEPSNIQPGTWGAFLSVSIAIPLFLGSLVAFFMPLSKKTKRIKCSSCGTESSVSEITTFQKLPVENAA